MRLPETEIKKGILHPEQFVRQHAAYSFCESLSTDPSIMPLVVQAIETHGWEHAFEFYNRFGKLAQTEDTLLWLVGELEKASQPRIQTEEEANHRFLLSDLIAKADVGLLLRHQARIVSLPGLFPGKRAVITERLRLLDFSIDACWQELERFCEAGKTKQYINEVDLSHANRLVEAIGRDRSSPRRVLSLLSQKIESYENNPMKWMEGLAVRLAGEMQLEAAIPLIVAKLYEDGDWVNDECIRALTMIGTDSVVEALCRDFASAPWHYRLYATGPLENLHSDLVVTKCLELYENEENGEIKENLIRGMLNSFATEGIEPARQWRRLPGTRELRSPLLAVSILTGGTFPELEDWLKEEQRDVEERHRRYKQMLGGYAPAKPKPNPPLLKNTADVLPVTSKKQVGRNDPCPCGSGKKYKKCCLNKGGGK